mgnify:CR=1 FL=1
MTRTHYGVLVEGRNYLMAMDDKTGKYGFFTTVFVSARSPRAAGHAAIQRVLRDPALNASMRNATDDPAWLRVTHLTSLASRMSGPRTRTGLCWFPDASRRSSRQRSRLAAATSRT